MSGYTPGPWEWTRYVDGTKALSPGVLLIGDYSGSGGPWGDEIDQANARLIAAAPELLEALKELVAAVTYSDPPKEFNGVNCHEARIPTDFVTIARAAIRKATEAAS